MNFPAINPPFMAKREPCRPRHPAIPPQTPPDNAKWRKKGITRK